MANANPEPPPRSTASDSDEIVRLVRAAQGGDRSAYGTLYERFARFVHGILLAYVSPDDVPDLVQDAFIHGLSKLGTLRDPAAFGVWLAQIARNMAKMKQRGGLRLVPIDDHLPAKDRTVDGELDGKVVLAAIRTLPVAYRETLVLRLVEGMSGEEIAERTGLTHGSVRVNLHRGMSMLREKLRGML